MLTPAAYIHATARSSPVNSGLHATGAGFIGLPPLRFVSFTMPMHAMSSTSWNDDFTCRVLPEYPLHLECVVYDVECVVYDVIMRGEVQR